MPHISVTLSPLSNEAEYFDHAQQGGHKRTYLETDDGAYKQLLLPREVEFPQQFVAGLCGHGPLIKAPHHEPDCESADGYAANQRQCKVFSSGHRSTLFMKRFGHDAKTALLLIQRS